MSSLSCDVRADLLARTGTGELHVYHNVGGTGLGTFSSIHQVVGTGWGGYSEINLGDVDWDGCADLLARSSTGALHIYYNNPSGGGLSYFLSPPATVGTGWGGYSEIELGQLSWNHGNSLLARSSNGELHLYYNTGGGGLSTFASPPAVVGTGWGGFSELTLGDVDNNGLDDLLARGSGGNLFVYYSSENGFPSPLSGDIVGTGWGAYSEINLGDVDGDGYADVLARSSAGALHVYYNTGGGSGLSTFHNTPQVVGTGWGGYNEINLG